MSTFGDDQILETFSDRELEILGLLAEGYTNKQIAQELFLSDETVKWYNKQIFSKLGVHNRTQAGIKAREVGLLTDGMPTTSAPRHSLPATPSSFVGRDEELVEIYQRLTDPTCRLLTLTGPGGIGKTRLALEAATRLLSEKSFLGGVYFVALAGVTSAAHVVSSIAESLGISMQPGSDPEAQLIQNLADRRQPTLLVLDNFEHLVHRADLVAAVLEAAPPMKIMLTSRERLNVRDEWLLDLKGLSFPERLQDGTTTFLDKPGDSETSYDAVQLFIERARQIDADINLKEESPAIIRICQLVEGMPLGLELAAAWVRVLPYAEIVREIEANLQFLSTSLRDVPTRHRSLMAVIDQSWRRLSSQEKRAFRRLSIFRGGFSREAAEQVTGASLSLLQALIDKSILRRTALKRFGFHELVRQYGAEKLVDAGEEEQIRDRHLAHFLVLAEKAEPRVWGSTPDVWLDRLEMEHDNMRTALQWSRDAPGRTQSGLQMAGALTAFWLSRSYFKEGREHLTSLLSKPDARDRTAARAKALNKAGFLAYIQSDYLSARPQLEESLSIYRDLGPAAKRGVASVLIRLGDLETGEGNYEAASVWSNESLSIARELGDVRGIGRALWQLGHCAVRSGDYEKAANILEEALPMWRQIEDRLSTAAVLSLLAEVKIRQGDYLHATALEEESLLLRKEYGFNRGISLSLGNLSLIALHQGDLHRASELLSQSLSRRQELGDKGGIAWCLEKMAEVDILQAERLPPAQSHRALQTAARLLGAAAALRERIHSIIDLADQPEYQGILDELRDKLGQVDYDDAWREGASLSVQQAIDLALSPDVSRGEVASTAVTVAARERRGGLTRRERETANLIAQGKSKRT